MNESNNSVLKDPSQPDTTEASNQSTNPQVLTLKNPPPTAPKPVVSDSANKKPLGEHKLATKMAPVDKENAHM